MSPYRDLEERLMANSVVERDSGCWLWCGHRTGYGYGTISVYVHALKRCLTRKVHRVAYETLVGPIPEGMDLDHTCFVPHCINPDHLRPTPVSINRSRNQWTKRKAEAPIERIV